MKQQSSTHIRIEIDTKALLDKVKLSGETYDRLLKRIARAQLDKGD